MSGVCAETISSGKAFQCLMTSMKYENLCASVGTNRVKSWTEFKLLGDGCGWGVKAVGGMHDSFLRILKQSFNFCMRLRIDSGFRSMQGGAQKRVA